MTSIQERFANANPANAAEKRKSSRDRVPMSLPQQKLSVPDIPGYHLHWMIGRADRLAQAERAGYTFVNQDEVDMNTVGLADGGNASGHSDLGSRVSHVSGTDEAGGQPVRLYLMKLPIEFWYEDQAKLAGVNENIAGVLRGDKGLQATGEGMDNSNRYVPKDAGNKNLFQPKRNRSL
jgi:hypothetical protein